MAAVAEAKRLRTTAKQRFTRAYNRLIEAIGDKGELDIIKAKYTDIQTLWMDVQTKHENYVFAKHPDEDEPVDEDEDQWLSNIEEKFEIAQKERFDYERHYDKKDDALLGLEAVRQQEEKVNKEMTVARRKVEVERKMFVEEFRSLQRMLKDDVTGVFKTQVKEAVKELKHQLERCNEACIGYEAVSIVPITNDLKSDDLFDDYEDIHKRSLKYFEVLSNYEAKRNKKKDGVRLERMKRPTFDGNVRNYARFKSDFKKQVEPQMEIDDVAYALKSCLSEDAAKLVESVDNDINKMWERLDETYGRPSLLIDVIMNDLKRMMKINEGDDKALIQLVDIVESGYANLKRLGIESEMSNTITLSLIEEKLPNSTRREWSKEVNKKESTVNKDNKFPSFLDFLIEQKRILEYERAELRIGDKNDIKEVYNTNNWNNTNGQMKRSRCIWHNSNGHTTDQCQNFLASTDEEKVKLIKENQACWSCLKGGHRLSGCWNKKVCGVNGCNMSHNELLHNAHASGISFHTTVYKLKGKQSSDTCLLQIMKIHSKDKILRVLWDSGASISLITFEKANELGLKGSKVNLSISKVGGMVEDVSSYKYTLPLIDEAKNIIPIVVYGINKISNAMHMANRNSLVQNFTGLQRNKVEISDGEIDVLIGFNYASLHPVKQKSFGNLLLMKNRFGHCLAGSHDLSGESKSMMIHKVVLHAVTKEENFLDIEQMGVKCVPACGGCKCGKCQTGGKNHSIKEEREQKLIEEGLSLEGGHFVAKYPWIRNPKELPDNRNTVLKMLENTEKRLLKNTEHAKVYGEQIKDMLDRNVARKLTNEELRSYTGPHYYLSHHEVWKIDSSTVCRIVFNSSLNFRNHILNDYWAKGPNLLNNLLGVLLRFREERVVLTGDIRKMYHAIKISLLDQHTHRFLWRNLDQKREPDTFVMTSVSFGDKPAGNIATTALRRTAYESETEFPEAAATILANTYMDDIIVSLENVEKAEKIASEIDIIIAKGNFQIKEWIISSKDYHCSGEESTKGFNDDSNQSVLGLVWDRYRDTLKFKIKLNFSEKKRGLYVGPNIEKDHIIERMENEVLTKRIVLSKVNSIYDPTGSITPFTITAKILMKRLWQKGLDWDDELKGEEKRKFQEFFISMFDLEDISFDRCIKPDNPVGKPVLVTFCDASNEAFGACSYIRWELEDGTYMAYLVASKSRVSPTIVLSIVRLELCAAVLGARLANFIEREMTFQFEKLLFIVDSQIVRCMINRDSYGFNTFVAVRIGEIQDTTDPQNWFWIDGSMNIADWITRGKKPEELHCDSLWQKGPAFLKEPISLWAIKKDENDIDVLPEEKKGIVTVIQNENSLIEKLNIERYSKYMKLICVTSRIIQAFQKDTKPSFKNIFKTPSASDIKKAEEFWVRDAQRLMEDEINKGNYLRLCPKRNEEGIFVVSGRAEKWFKDTYNPDGVILLPHSHRISYLYALWVHNIDHLGVAATISKIRSRFWITQITKLVSGIRSKCVTCKKLDKVLAGQRMSQLPEHRLKPSPAFQNTYVDLFGPFQIRGLVNKRTRGKCFGVLYTCGSSRAVYGDLSQDYSTDGFLQTTRRFVTLRGYPKDMYSDSGSQIMAADREIQNLCKKLDLEQLKRFGADKGLTWHFSTPGAAWQNGCVEALIKSIKKCITIAVGDQVLSFPELQTVIFEAANLVNERPIGIYNRNIEDGSYLSPNDLLLGRASARVPAGPFKEYTSIKQRHAFIQSIVDSFWKRWQRDFFPSLIIRQKWHVQKRNVCMGDIVLIKDCGAIRGTWKLGKIVKLHDNADKLIRNVDVQYKCNIDDKLITVKRAVQNLVVILPVEEDVNS